MAAFPLSGPTPDRVAATVRDSLFLFLPLGACNQRAVSYSACHGNRDGGVLFTARPWEWVSGWLILSSLRETEVVASFKVAPFSSAQDQVSSPWPCDSCGSIESSTPLTSHLGQSQQLSADCRPHSLPPSSDLRIRILTSSLDQPQA